jgi:hypothetical protein
MSEERANRDAYDRIIGQIDGLPDVRKARPSTVTTVLPILGNSQTYVVQTYKDREEGFYGFVQMIDAEGRARIVLPPKVMAAIYRQRDALIKAQRRDQHRDRWANLTEEQKEARVAHLRKAKSA